MRADLDKESARYQALAIVRRLNDVGGMVKRDPARVRVATDGDGNRVAFWYAGGREVNFNVTEAERKLNELVRVHGSDVLKSRSGRIADVRVELPIGKG